MTSLLAWRSALSCSHLAIRPLGAHCNEAELVLSLHESCQFCVVHGDLELRYDHLRAVARLDAEAADLLGLEDCNVALKKYGRDMCKDSSPVP